MEDSVLIFLLFIIAYGSVKLYRHLYSKTIERLWERTVVISGCDTGFGRLLACRLVNQGTRVIAGLYDEKNEKILRSKILDQKLLQVYPLDVTSDESVAQFAYIVDGLVENDGIWGIVANAGILGNTGPDDWLNVNDYINTMQVNTFGVIRFIQSLKHQVKVQKGRVVIISSVSGRTPRPTVGPYCVSKHAVEAYADVIRHELIDFGVSVHMLEPGFFTTPITQTATDDLDNVWRRLDEQKKLEYGKQYFVDYKLARLSRLSHCEDNLDPVLEAYEHALFGKYPKSRYWVGWDTVFFYIPLATLPTFVQNWVISFQRRHRPIPAVMLDAAKYK